MEEKMANEETENEKEIPKGFYLAEIPTGFANVIAFNGKQVSAEELLVKIANSMLNAGILKE
jgi:hypothetical protein